MSRGPLHTQNPLGRFSDRATDYASYRPSYAEGAIAAVLADLGEPSTLTVADVGAGTGISSRLLGDRGVQVWAIEPNAAMRDAAAPHPRVAFIDGTAEATGLGDRTVDGVTCCQAFHWFRKDEALAEFHRILKPGGRVALLWNQRDVDDPATHEYDEILRQVSDPNVFERNDRKSALPLQQSPLFTNYREAVFVHAHPLTFSGLLGLAQSASYVSKAPQQVALLTQNLDAFCKNWGTVESAVPLQYKTVVYLADAIA